MADDKALRKSFKRDRTEEDSFLSWEELERVGRMERERSEKGKMEGWGKEIHATLAVVYDADDVVLSLILFPSLNGFFPSPSRLLHLSSRNKPPFLEKTITALKDGTERAHGGAW
ncbi:hypothetical protein BT69DRAFT_1330526 [Atractiella rhizophila]|nr:hypothetical protein BT69DRAFT_1330526 [Atractiella rhizophila]